MQSYVTWQTDPTPEHMGAVLRELSPIITQEIHRYAGPKPLLRSRARILALGAIRKYDPSTGVPLGAYIRQQLQPLSRYSANLRPVSVSEALVQRAAQLNTHREQLALRLHREPTEEELADETGLSVAKIRKYRAQVPAVTAESAVVNEQGETHLPAFYQTSHMREAAESVYTDLDDTDRAIYDGRINQDIRANELARRLNISPAAVSQRAARIADQIQRTHDHVMG